MAGINRINLAGTTYDIQMSKVLSSKIMDESGQHDLDSNFDGLVGCGLAIPARHITSMSNSITLAPHAHTYVVYAEGGTPSSSTSSNVVAGTPYVTIKVSNASSISGNLKEPKDGDIMMLHIKNTISSTQPYPVYINFNTTAPSTSNPGILVCKSYSSTTGITPWTLSAGAMTAGMYMFVYTTKLNGLSESSASTSLINYSKGGWIFIYNNTLKS